MLWCLTREQEGISNTGSDLAAEREAGSEGGTAKLLKKQRESL